MGDINIHVEDHSNTEATIFNDTMKALGTTTTCRQTYAPLR